MTHSTTCETMKEAGDQLGAKACGAMRTAEQTAGDWAQKAQNNLDSLREWLPATSSKASRKHRNWAVP